MKKNCVPNTSIHRPVDWNYSVPNTSIHSSWNRKTVYLIQVYTDQLIETTVYLIQVYTAVEKNCVPNTSIHRPVDWNYSVPNTSIHKSWNRITVYLIQVYTDQLIETTVYLIQVTQRYSWAVFMTVK